MPQNNSESGSMEEEHLSSDEKPAKKILNFYQSAVVISYASQIAMMLE